MYYTFKSFTTHVYALTMMKMLYLYMEKRNIEGE